MKILNYIDNIIIIYVAQINEILENCLQVGNILKLIYVYIIKDWINN